MSKFEEKKYKQTLENNTPDLWDKINDGLSSDDYIKDSKPNMNMTQKEDNSSPRIKSSKIYKISGLIAACIALLIIPILYSNNNKANDMLTAKNEMADISNNVTDNIGDPESAIADNSKNDNTYNTIVSEDSIVSDDSSADNITEPSLDKETSNDTINQPNPSKYKLSINVTALHNTDQVGLIYEGIITTSTSDKLPVDTNIFISLSRLSRTDLRHTYKVGETITFTIDDISYSSTKEKPYFVTSLIHK